MIIQPVSFFPSLKSGAKRLGHFGGAKVLAAHAGAGALAPGRGSFATKGIGRSRMVNRMINELVG